MITIETKEYIEHNIGRELTEQEIKKIKTHQKRYNLDSVCAYYYNWEDFCSDWCDDLGYTRTQARKLLHGGKGEFQTIDTLGILRYDM